MQTRFIKFLKITFVLAILSIPATLFAQGPGFENDIEDEVPFDGGISILAVSGIAYGVRKIMKNKKEQL